MTPLDLKRKSSLLQRISDLKVTLREIAAIWQKEAQEVEVEVVAEGKGQAQVERVKGVFVFVRCQCKTILINILS